MCSNFKALNEEDLKDLLVNVSYAGLNEISDECKKEEY